MFSGVWLHPGECFRWCLPISISKNKIIFYHSHQKSSSSITVITYVKAIWSIKIIVTFSNIREAYSLTVSNLLISELDSCLPFFIQKSHWCVFFPKEQIVTLSLHQVHSFVQEKMYWVPLLWQVLLKIQRLGEPAIAFVLMELSVVGVTDMNQVIICMVTARLYNVKEGNRMLQDCNSLMKPPCSER